MSFKRANKKILLVLVILLFSVLLINGKKITHAFTNLLNGKSEGTVLEEDELSNVVNEMYITILDDKANVVATTNPNTTVYSDYAFTATTNPRKYVSYSGKYILLFEVKDTASLDKNKTLLKEDVIYNMTLPEYMMGYETYPEDSNVTNECLEFISENDLQACAGVYGTNHLQMLFSSLGDKYDIRFNYQFFIEFDDSGRTQDPSIKTFDFGKFGSLQLMFEGEPVPTVQDGTNYKVTVTNNGNTSITNNYSKWTVDLKNLKDSLEYNGYLEIEYGSYLGLAIDRNNVYENIDISIDGAVLDKKYNDDDLGGCFYNDSNDCLIPFSIVNKDSIAGGGNDAALAKKIKLDLSSSDLEGIENIKVVSTLKNYVTYGTNASSVYLTVTANYVDSDNLLDRYLSSMGTYSSFSNPSTPVVNVIYDKEGLVPGEIADSIKVNTTVNMGTKNYIAIDGGSGDYSNDMGAYYYMSSKGFMADAPDISDTFTVKINDQEVTFERLSDININYLVNGIDKIDPAVQRQMAAVIDTYADNVDGNLHNILRGPKNADGDYYWLVISKTTLNIANYNSDGNNIYDSSSNSGVLGVPAAWKIYFFNVSKSKIEVEWDSYLEKVNYNRVDTSSRSVYFQTTINGYSYYDKYTDILTNPLILRSEFLNDGFVKWDAILDTKVLKNDSDLIHEMALNVYLPSIMSIPSQGYYDPSSNSYMGIAGSGNGNMLDISLPYICLGEVENRINSCTDYQAYSENGFGTGTTNSNYSISADNKYTVTLNNVPTRNEGYVHIVFFTKVSFADQYSYSFNSYGVNVETVINSNINDFETDSLGGNSPMRRYDIVSKSSVYYPYTDSNGDFGMGNNETVYTEVYLYSEFSYGSSLNSACGNNLSNRYNCYKQPLFNGRYQFFIQNPDYYNQTYFDEIHISINNGAHILNATQLMEYFDGGVSIDPDPFDPGSAPYTPAGDSSESAVEICEEDDGGNLIPNGICATIRKGYYGYTVEITNLDDVYYISAETKVLTDFSGYTGSINLSNNYYAYYVYAVPFEWNPNENSYGNSNALYYYSEYYPEADLAIYAENFLLSEFEGLYTANVDLKDSYTDYVRIRPFVVSSYNYTLKKAASTEIPIEDLREYLILKDLNINVTSSVGSYTVYSNEEFNSNFAGSTITFDDTGNGLFDVKLVLPSELRNLASELSFSMSYRIELKPEVREQDFYNGGHVSLRVNTLAERLYDCPSCSAINQGQQFPSTFDPTTGIMQVHAGRYAGNISFIHYLYPPAVNKIGLGDGEYQINYTVRGAGKNGPVEVKLFDEASIQTSNYYTNLNTYFIQLKGLYAKYTKYKNVKLTYENETYDVPETSGEFNIGTIPATVEYLEDSLGAKIRFQPNNYNDTVVVTYKLETDYSSFYSEAMERGILSADGKLNGFTNVLTFRTYNVAKDENSNDSDGENSGYISVSDVKAKITKKNSTLGVDSHKWTVSFNTGVDSQPITIEDNLELIVDESQLEAYTNALEFSNLVIKVDGIVIYQNNEFTEGWENTVTINRDGLKTTYLFKDTDTKEFTGGNSAIVIEYVTKLDFDKLDEYLSSINVTLKNTSTLVKSGLNDSAFSTATITRTYGHQVSKAKLGNTANDLTEANWKIEVQADDKSEKNVRFTDTMTLGSEFGDYLSISKFRIEYKETPNSEIRILYDSATNVNNLGDIVLSMNNNEAFEIGVNGKYNFNILIPELKAKSSITITYTTKVDKEEYILAGEVLDKELVITNKLVDEFFNRTYTQIASTKVSADISKKFTSLGKDATGFTRIKWMVDVNLAEYYNLSDLDGLNVTVTDDISNVFGLEPESVEVRYLTVNANGNVVGNKLAADKYEVTTEDNVVVVKLLDPTNTPNVEISFVTKVMGSITNVKNTVVLEVGNKKKEVKIEDEVPIYVPSVFGVVYSRDMLTYSLYGQKYLDGKITDEAFKFSVTEVDSAGNEIDDGYLTISTNGADGRIEFNGIKYSQAGTYYYKIQEVIDDDKYEYDKTEYTVKVVVEGDDEFRIGSVEVLNANEIVFNNRSVTTSSETEEEEERPNPNTSAFMKTAVVIIFVISMFAVVYMYKKFSFLK